MPPIAVGSTTPKTVRHRLTPSARLASRSPPGTSASTSWVARATIGTIRIESANAPARALWPRPATTTPKTKMPTTIAGIPFITSRTTRTNVPMLLVRELGDVDRDEHADRHCDQRRDRHDQAAADDRVRDSTRLAEERREAL